MIIYDVRTWVILKAAYHIFTLYDLKETVRHDSNAYDITASRL